MVKEFRARLSRLEQARGAYRSRFIAVSGLATEADARAYLATQGIVTSNDDMVIAEPGTGQPAVEITLVSMPHEDALALLEVEGHGIAALNSIKGNQHVGIA